MPAYLGVQCYQCSGFQVIQEKKSSNKWACALCGEKQSVRKVWARSEAAKDVRLRVQELNMRRGEMDQTALDRLYADVDDGPFPDSLPGEAAATIVPKQESKWAAYWEEEQDKQQAEGEECEAQDDGMYVTALPDRKRGGGRAGGGRSGGGGRRVHHKGGGDDDVDGQPQPKKHRVFGKGGGGGRGGGRASDLPALSSSRVPSRWQQQQQQDQHQQGKLDTGYPHRDFASSSTRPGIISRDWAEGGGGGSRHQRPAPVAGQGDPGGSSGWTQVQDPGSILHPAKQASKQSSSGRWGAYGALAGDQKSRTGGGDENGGSIVECGLGGLIAVELPIDHALDQQQPSRGAWGAASRVALQEVTSQGAEGGVGMTGGECARQDSSRVNSSSRWAAYM